MPNLDLYDFFRRYVATLNAHEFDRLEEFVHRDVTVNGESLSRDQLIAELKGHVDAVPDLVWQLQNLAVDGNQVAAYFFSGGTPVKDWLGAKPTGARVRYTEHVFHKLRDGRFNQLNFLLDTWSVHKQLGPS